MRFFPKGEPLNGSEMSLCGGERAKKAAAMVTVRLNEYTDSTSVMKMLFILVLSAFVLFFFFLFPFFLLDLWGIYVDCAGNIDLLVNHQLPFLKNF